MTTETTTDQVTIQIVNSTDKCICRHEQTVVAQITVTVDGRTHSWMACKRDVNWYMGTKGVVNSAGEQIPVVLA
jgi:hypothetical protein